jgi:hypothetical protein
VNAASAIKLQGEKWKKTQGKACDKNKLKEGKGEFRSKEKIKKIHAGSGGERRARRPKRPNSRVAPVGCGLLTGW